MNWFRVFILCFILTPLDYSQGMSFIDWLTGKENIQETAAKKVRKDLNVADNTESSNTLQRVLHVGDKLLAGAATVYTSYSISESFGWITGGVSGVVTGAAWLAQGPLRKISSAVNSCRRKRFAPLGAAEDEKPLPITEVVLGTIAAAVPHVPKLLLGVSVLVHPWIGTGDCLSDHPYAQTSAFAFVLWHALQAGWDSVNFIRCLSDPDKRKLWFLLNSYRHYLLHRQVSEGTFKENFRLGSIKSRLLLGLATSASTLAASQGIDFLVRAGSLEFLWTPCPNGPLPTTPEEWVKFQRDSSNLTYQFGFFEAAVIWELAKGGWKWSGNLYETITRKNLLSPSSLAFFLSNSIAGLMGLIVSDRIGGTAMDSQGLTIDKHNPDIKASFIALLKGVNQVKVDTPFGPLMPFNYSALKFSQFASAVADESGVITEPLRVNAGQQPGDGIWLQIPVTFATIAWVSPLIFKGLQIVFNQISKLHDSDLEKAHGIEELLRQLPWMSSKEVKQLCDKLELSSKNLGNPPNASHRREFEYWIDPTKQQKSFSSMIGEEKFLSALEREMGWRHTISFLRLDWDRSSRLKALSKIMATGICCWGAVVPLHVILAQSIMPLLGYPVELGDGSATDQMAVKISIIITHTILGIKFFPVLYEMLWDDISKISSKDKFRVSEEFKYHKPKTDRLIEGIRFSLASGDTSFMLAAWIPTLDGTILDTIGILSAFPFFATQVRQDMEASENFEVMLKEILKKSKSHKKNILEAVISLKKQIREGSIKLEDYIDSSGRLKILDLISKSRPNILRNKGFREKTISLLTFPNLLSFGVNATGSYAAYSALHLVFSNFTGSSEVGYVLASIFINSLTLRGIKGLSKYLEGWVGVFKWNSDPESPHVNAQYARKAFEVADKLLLPLMGAYVLDSGMKAFGAKGKSWSDLMDLSPFQITSLMCMALAEGAQLHNLFRVWTDRLVTAFSPAYSPGKISDSKKFLCLNFSLYTKDKAALKTQMLIQLDAFERMIKKGVSRKLVDNIHTKIPKKSRRHLSVVAPTRERALRVGIMVEMGSNTSSSATTTNPMRLGGK